jgi:hypothetical protein
MPQFKAADLFGGTDEKLTNAELSQRFDSYEQTLIKALDNPMVIRPDQLPTNNGGHGIDFTRRSGFSELQAVAQRADIVKSLSPDSLAALQATLEQLRTASPDLMKDISTTSPVSQGLVTYDLYPAAIMLAPKMTVLRNRIPRRKGVGLNHQYKRILGFTGTGTGGVGVTWPGITDSSQANFANPGSGNALYLNRGAKISYAGDMQTVPYMQFGLSDELSWSTQYAGIGFTDVRALSRTSTMYSSFLVEERMMLYARGTASGYSGTLAIPTGVAGAARSAAAGETGISGVTTNIYVRVVAELGDFGVSQATAASSAIPVTAGQVADITYTLPYGATGARVFVSTGASDPGDASRFLYVFTGGGVYNGRSGYNKITIQGALPTSGPVPTAYTNSTGAAINLTSTDGGSAFATGYDGIHAYCTSANAGYRTQLNGKFSNTVPGTEFQTAFATMFLATKADPDRILMAAQDREQLSQAVQGSSSNNYRFTISQSEVDGITIGSIVTEIRNQSTGKLVPMETHPWMPQGNAEILSDSLPIPDSNVESIWQMRGPQDIMGIDWPVIQTSYDTGTWWFNTMICYAPAWNGSISGIQAV